MESTLDSSRCHSFHSDSAALFSDLKNDFIISWWNMFRFNFVRFSCWDHISGWLWSLFLWLSPSPFWRSFVQLWLVVEVTLLNFFFCMIVHARISVEAYFSHCMVNSFHAHDSRNCERVLILWYLLLVWSGSARSFEVLFCSRRFIWQGLCNHRQG